MRFEKWSKDLGFENFDGNMRLLGFELVTRTHAKFLEVCRSRHPSSFRNQIFPLLVVLEKRHMKLNVGKVVDRMTRRSSIPTDLVKSRDDDSSSIVHYIEIGAYEVRIKPI